MARPSCFKLLLHCDRRAASRADCTAGRSSATSTPIIAITTSNSTSVKPSRCRERALIRDIMFHPLEKLLPTRAPRAANCFRCGRFGRGLTIWKKRLFNPFSSPLSWRTLAQDSADYSESRARLYSFRITNAPGEWIVDKFPAMTAECPLPSRLKRGSLPNV